MKIFIGELYFSDNQIQAIANAALDDGRASAARSAMESSAPTPLPDGAMTPVVNGLTEGALDDGMKSAMRSQVSIFRDQGSRYQEFGTGTVNDKNEVWYQNFRSSLELKILKRKLNQGPNQDPMSMKLMKAPMK